MADTNLTIKDQINNMRGLEGLAALGAVRLGDWLAGQLKPLTDSVARTVTDSILEMDVPARITAVVATAGGATGIQLIGPEGATTATKQCTIAYDTNGFATITFHAADAVTAAKVTYATYPEPTFNSVTGLGEVLEAVPT